MVFSFGSVTIVRSTSGFLPKGKTTNSTSSVLGGQFLAALPHVGLDAGGQAAERLGGIGQPYPGQRRLR